MALDFQQIHEQVRKLGETEPEHQKKLQSKLEQALAVLKSFAIELDHLKDQVGQIVRKDPSLRCALPINEPLDSHFPLPEILDSNVTLLAADGSQIYLDRHAPIDYFLINVGSIHMRTGVPAAPNPEIESRLYYGEQLYAEGIYFSEEKVSFLRDLREREALSRLAKTVAKPILTLTDGHLELWGGRTNGPEQLDERQSSLDAYLDALQASFNEGAITAGYVEKPSEDHAVRLLEIAVTSPDEYKKRPFIGIKDADLFSRILAPGERSATFEFQSRADIHYKQRDENLALCFFYVNVGRVGNPWIARVDTLGWVAQDADSLDMLHAILIDQCRILGSRPYPYLLHRAHEAAVVSREEKAQVEQMIAGELLRRGVPLGQVSNKQATKNLPGRTRYPG